MKRVPSNLILDKDYLDIDDSFISIKRFIDNDYGDICVGLGIDEDNKCHYVDFRDISILLISGETGSGKSIFLDTIIISLMLKNSYDDVKFVMMDPKRIELSYYNKLSYMLGDTLSNSDDCYRRFKDIRKEYLRRKELFKDEDINNILEYNLKYKYNGLYRLFVFIDESCDIMKYDDIEDILREFNNDSYLYGIHIVMVTNSIGKRFFDEDFIKDIRYRISFDLASKADASIIGNSDSSYLNSPGEAVAIQGGSRKKIKIKTPYISDEDIMRVVKYIGDKKKYS